MLAFARPLNPPDLEPRATLAKSSAFGSTLKSMPILGVTNDHRSRRSTRSNDVGSLLSSLGIASPLPRTSSSVRVFGSNSAEAKAAKGEYFPRHFFDSTV